MNDLNIKKLMNNDLFSNMDDKAIERMLEYFNGLNLEQGEVLFSQDDKSDTLYLIYSGSLSVNITIPNQGINKITTISAGSFFGEISLLTELNRIATIIAETDACLLYLPKQVFEKLINNQYIPALQLSHNIARTLAQRLNLTNQYIHPSQI